MKFVISKTELSNLIGIIQNVVPQQKTPIPILSNFLIEAVNDELIFTATDLTVGVRRFTPAKILNEGSTTLPAKRFFQLIKELPAVNIEITTNGNNISEIVAGASRFKLHGMSKNEYPSLPDLGGAQQIKMKQEVLKDMLFRTSFAVAREDERHALTGVLLRISGDSAIFVGTDGKRLAKAQTTLTPAPAIGGDYILPLKAVDEVVKVLGDKDDVTLYLMKDKIAIEANQVTIISKLLSGDYPHFERVIPENPEISLSLHREELMSMLRQVSLFTLDAYHSVRFTFFNGELILSANTMEIGEGKTSMPVNYQGPKLEIAFHPVLFLDVLRHSKDETVTLQITDAYNPGMITDSSSAVYVIMPMRLNEDV